jgi:hypothetical protein
MAVRRCFKRCFRWQVSGNMLGLGEVKASLKNLKSLQYLDASLTGIIYE